MEYYSAIKQNEILLFVTSWINLEGIMLSEISQAKTNSILFHSYVESNLKKKQTHRYREQISSYQRESGLGVGEMCGGSLLYGDEW